MWDAHPIPKFADFVFLPEAIARSDGGFGAELVRQLLSNTDYLAASGKSIPAQFNVPRETAHPEFIQVDFGLARNAAGELEPELVEIQGFPSLYCFQTVLAQQYIQAYQLNKRLQFILGGMDLDEYRELLRRAVLGDRDPENVVLMGIDPEKQKTLPDFLLTERVCGIKTVNAMEVMKEGGRLFYLNHGRRTPIHRIYNRVIADELLRKKKQLPFSFRDDLAVEWAGHPNWYFHLSKFSLPYLRHPCVPKTWFLHQVNPVSEDLSNYVLKPLYSFAGTGVIVGPTRENLAAIPEAERPECILQERVDFMPLIETPHGPTKAELRIMYVWVGTLRPGPVLVRMGRGKMMGVDYNRDMQWVGSSAGLFLDE